MTLNLHDILGGSVWAFMLLLCRLGSTIMLMPGWGESSVPPRVRMALAVFVTIAAFPLLSPQMPAQPESVVKMAGAVFSELAVGLYMGLIGRILVSTLESAGAKIAQSINLSNAFMFNPLMAQQGTVTGALLSFVGIVLLFASDMHLLLLTGLIGSYEAFPPATLPPIADMTRGIITVAESSFVIATQLAMPFLITTIMLNISLGVLSRLMPQMQVFFVAMPIQVLFGLFLFALTIGGTMLVWLQSFDAGYHTVVPILP